MARAMVLMVIGALAGGAVVYAWLGTDPFAGPASSAVSADLVASNSRAEVSAGQQPAVSAVASNPSSDGAQAIPAASGFASERIAIYERVAALGDRETLSAEISRVAAEPTSRLRDIELDALLSRLAELDPAAAVNLARRLYLPARFLEPLFAAWAAVDMDAALRVVAVIQPPARQQQLALSVLRSQGGDPAALEQIVAMLPAAQRFGFEHSSLMERAERDPVGAIAAALAMGAGSWRMLVAREVVGRAAATDPIAALAAVDSMAKADVRGDLQNLILTVWAQTDPDRVFAWLESSAGPDLTASSGMFLSLAQADQTRALALIENLAPARRAPAMQGLVQAAAASDPAAAIPLFELLPPGQDRDRLLSTFGNRWGAVDPDRALAWARGLKPPSDDAVRNVLQGIASADPDRAIDMVLAELDAGSQSGLAGRLPSPVLSLIPALTMSSDSGVDVPRLLDRLIERSDPQVNTVLASTMSRWTREQPEQALNWALTNSTSLDANALLQVAWQLVDVDAELAINSLSRLLPEQRAGWLDGVVGRLAQTDINRAVSVLDQYRGQPGYDDAYGNMLMQHSRVNPQEAARLFDSAGVTQASDSTASAAVSIGREWSRRDPMAAANWAQSLSDPQTQQRTTGTIAQIWAQTDSAGARRWLVGLSRGPVRDRALDNYLHTVAQLGEFDAGLLDSYSNAGLAEQGASRAIAQIGRSDPEEAQRLLDIYITDANLRQQTQGQFAPTATVGGGTAIISNGSSVLR